MTLTGELERRAHVDDTLAPFSNALAAVDTNKIQRGPVPALTHPGMTDLQAAIAASDDRTGLLPLATGFDWSKVFAGGGIDPALADNMLAAQVVGTYGCFASETVAAGYFLLRPGVQYPFHTHRAAEVYLCLSGVMGLQHGIDGRPFDIGCGDHSVTPPDRLHELTVGSEPVVVAYVWHGDLTAPAWWWSRTDDGWQRTLWRRKPGESWMAEHSEPVSGASWVEAHGQTLT